ncbi:hypothetical protein [Paludisphaera soli]|uniref:hypothetical protein n=1 Tax=Paludisphaera soli TaxID=2712865 RepID=UPI0013EA5603|nr:hypothetical protein [Paludisphaera soli]
MTKRTPASLAATALAAALFCGCGGSDGDLSAGMPQNIDLSKVSDPMARGDQGKLIGKPAKPAKKAR